MTNPSAGSVAVPAEEEGTTFAVCKLDRSDCDHEFTQEGNPDTDCCVKCGQSIWAWAFMEMP